MKSQFKKSISLICALVLIISVLSLTACGKDSDPIVGTWQAAPGSSLGNYWGSGVKRLTFNKDGSYSCTLGLPTGELDLNGTYRMIHDGAAIELDGKVSYDCEFLSNDQMSWNDDGDEYILERID